MAKQSLKRDFSGKAVDMLSTCETIIQHAIDHKEFLQKKRNTWADPFFDNILAKIQKAYSEHLGIDNAKELREATRKVHEIQDAAVKILAEFKVQLTEDFKADKEKQTELLRNLGFTQFHKKAQRGDQEELIQLLFQFKDNMSPDLKAEIISKGTAESTIDEIIAHADVLRDLNITQETLKGNRKEITQAALAEFNAIYNEVISVAKIAAKFFKGDKAVQEQFSYNKIKKRLSI
jgi:hypothetical protein